MYVKGILGLAAIVLLTGCLSTEPAYEENYSPGTYEGIGRGYRGDIRVRLQVGLAGIEDIVIASHRESAFPGLAAMEELLEDILVYGETDLDVVSGATFSSRGFLEAVENALKRARGN